MLLSSLLAMCLALGVECSRPRGVRQEVASLYTPAQDFRCFDGSNTVPFIQVNDDYCDCEDGSDEPGTSACPSGKFYCENSGHKALVLPSSRVGDGLCDCCDGSDEWETQANCQNTCSELGRAAREAREAELKAALEGFNIRRGMVDEAKRLREEKVADLAVKEARRDELEAVKVERESEKEATEVPEKEALDFYRRVEEEERRKQEEQEKEAADAEAAEYFTGLDSDGDGWVTMAELQQRPGLDTNKDGEVSEEEAKFFLSDLDQFDLASFKSTGFVLLKPYLDLDATAEPAETEEEAAKKEEEGTVPEVDWHPMMTPEPPAADPDAPDHPMMTPPPPTYDEEEEDMDDEDKDDDYDINDQDDDDVVDVVPEEKIEEESKYDEATKALIAVAEAARKAFTEAERELGDTVREIKEVKDSLEKDYGEEGEFSVLVGQCFELTDNEYKYTMCAFDHCSQKPKHGGSETRLGSWGSWEGGEGVDKYRVMKFTGGQGCWNGPARSTTVHLHCGTDNIVTHVSEPNKCEYEMHFTTPAICRQLTSGHDEL